MGMKNLYSVYEKLSIDDIVIDNVNFNIQKCPDDFNKAFKYFLKAINFDKNSKKADIHSLEFEFRYNTPIGGLDVEIKGDKKEIIEYIINSPKRYQSHIGWFEGIHGPKNAVLNIGLYQLYTRVFNSSGKETIEFLANLYNKFVG